VSAGSCIEGAFLEYDAPWPEVWQPVMGYGYIKVNGYQLLFFSFLQLSVNACLIFFFFGWCILISGYWKLALSTARMAYVRPRHEQQPLKGAIGSLYASSAWPVGCNGQMIGCLNYPLSLAHAVQNVSLSLAAQIRENRAYPRSQARMVRGRCTSKRE